MNKEGIGYIFSYAMYRRDNNKFDKIFNRNHELVEIEFISLYI